jgi:predicted alpha/beta superfamily hydrolase
MIARVQRVASRGWRNRARRVVACALTMSLGAATLGQDRVDVTFQLNYNQTQVGQSVFVLGSIPELGADDIRKAVKLEPTTWPVWKGTFSLPAGTSYSYRFVRRDDGPGRLGDVNNQVAIGSTINSQTPPAVPSSAPASKAVMFHSSMSNPVLSWRLAGSAGAFTQTSMTLAGPGRGGGGNFNRWLAIDVAQGGKAFEMFFTGGDGVSREPSVGVYSTSLDAVFVQDGQLYSYVPAPSVGAWRRDYTVGSLPSIQSVPGNLNERRSYRVVLPRGYDNHPTRRYPVVYLHDGQNVFEAGAFGTWNAHTSAGTLTSAGQMRESILVGIDNGPNRISDYSAPDAGGWGDRYVRFIRDELKPVIDGGYRTLTGAADTAAIGSSMGGHISLYMGWDFTSSFTRIGAFSGAFQIYTSGFYNRVQSQPRRNIRLYLDSGDAGTANDNYWPILNLRDNLMNPARAGGVGGAFTLEGSMKHVIGLGQQHNEAAWSQRLPDAYRFLLPATEEQGPLLPLATEAIFDVDSDGDATTDDLYAQYASGVDVNLDGTISDADAALVEWYLRRGEVAAMTGSRR